MDQWTGEHTGSSRLSHNHSPPAEDMKVKDDEKGIESQRAATNHRAETGEMLSSLRSKVTIQASKAA